MRPITPCRSKSASSASISPWSTALSGRTTTLTRSTSSRAATSIRSTRSRSSPSEGANSKKPKGSLAGSAHRARQRTEIRLAHPQRPGQQQVVDPHVVGPVPRAAATHLVPPGLYTGTVHAGVARERAQRGAVRGRQDLWQHSDKVRRDAAQGSRPGQQLPAARSIEEAVSIGLRRGQRPRPAQASSAIAWSVSSASQSRQSCASREALERELSPLRGRPPTPGPGGPGPVRSHPRPKRSTGGPRRPPRRPTRGCDRAATRLRPAGTRQSDTPRSARGVTSVSAKRSGGHSSSSSPIAPPGRRLPHRRRRRAPRSRPRACSRQCPAGRTGWAETIAWSRVVHRLDLPEAAIGVVREHGVRLGRGLGEVVVVVARTPRGQAPP